MALKLIVVIGATGTQGGSVVDTFLNEPGWTIRGLTRNTSSRASQALTAKGVEMVSANLDDVPSLVTAFQGAHAIFSVTDFWNGFRNPENKSKLAPGQTMMEWAHDYELQQGKNVFTAAAQTHTLERLVFSALPYVTKWSKGKYTHVYHFDAEGRAVEYARSTYPELMQKTSVIQLGIYLTNILWMPHYQPHKNADGVYVFRTKMAADRKIPLVATREDTGPLTKALVNVDGGKTLLAYRELITLDEFADTWGRALGVKTKYVPTGPGEVWVPIPELQEDIEECADYITEFGYEGGDPSVVHPKDLGVPINLGTVEEWIKKQDWSAVM
ncbi:hypothetical protein A1O1_03898 [Capronia coronata CBS 617.96]|uniref:NmrA-like domain-containing protein n=1 Tax=Capronia coronata CBS 617.96 TaxID=1182541 RepID=W9Z8E2_9EURO|nr:uncharacterized protein A1O1_03898 [Capronia coronata CBS 617.96]EXJ90794.1 hypothetical protein A1O1_03898 [Capronia coronata CBS 617.96]